MKILLTGGTGLLGRNIIECLLEGNHEITLLLRDPTKYNKQNEKITKVKGDVLNLKSILDAIGKCECVIHAAADTSQHHLNISDFKVNIQGTKNIVLACKKKNIKRLIHVGSAGFFGYGSKQNPGNENSTIKYPSNQSLYLKSKLHAQEEIDAYGKSNSVITIHPTFMIGALDYGPSSGKIILMSTHILEEAEAICDRVLIINGGRLVKDAPTSSLVDKKGRLEESIKVFAS